MSAASALALSALLALAPLAQAQPAGAPAPAAPAPATAPSAPAAPTLPEGVVATTNNPNLSVSTVKLEQGVRLGEIIGEDVQNERGEKLGEVHDLIMTGGDRVTIAVIATGGFLGLGAKLVAVPWSQLQPGNDKVVLPGATAESLTAMPAFTY